MYRYFAKDKRYKNSEKNLKFIKDYLDKNGYEIDSIRNGVIQGFVGVTSFGVQFHKDFSKRVANDLTESLDNFDVDLIGEVIKTVDNSNKFVSSINQSKTLNLQSVGTVNFNELDLKDPDVIFDMSAIKKHFPTKYKKLHHNVFYNVAKQHGLNIKQARADFFARELGLSNNTPEKEFLKKWKSYIKSDSFKELSDKTQKNIHSFKQNILNDIRDGKTSKVTPKQVLKEISEEMNSVSVPDIKDAWSDPKMVFSNEKLSKHLGVAENNLHIKLRTLKTSKKEIRLGLLEKELNLPEKPTLKILNLRWRKFIVDNKFSRNELLTVNFYKKFIVEKHNLVIK